MQTSSDFAWGVLVGYLIALGIEALSMARDEFEKFAGLKDAGVQQIKDGESMIRAGETGSRQWAFKGILRAAFLVALTAIAVAWALG